MYGCRTQGTPTSPPMAAKKATRFLSNSLEMLGRLNRRCDGSHEHKQLRGKELAEAAFYPAGLIHAIIQGMNLTHAADLVRRSISNDRRSDSLCSAKRINGYGTENKVLGTCKMKKTTGGTRQIVYDQINFKKAYYDEYTGEQLPEELVRAAIIEELNYFSEEGVWENAKYAKLNSNP